MAREIVAFSVDYGVVPAHRTPTVSGALCLTTHRAAVSSFVLAGRGRFSTALTTSWVPPNRVEDVCGQHSDIRNRQRHSRSRLVDDLYSRPLPIN